MSRKTSLARGKSKLRVFSGSINVWIILSALNLSKGRGDGVRICKLFAETIVPARATAKTGAKSRLIGGCHYCLESEQH